MEASAAPPVPRLPLPALIFPPACALHALAPSRSCDNGAGRIYPFRLCTLKRQPVSADGRPTLASYGAGPGVPWTSGYIVQSGGGGTPSGPAPQQAQPAAAALPPAGSGSAGAASLAAGALAQARARAQAAVQGAMQMLPDQVQLVPGRL